MSIDDMDDAPPLLAGRLSAQRQCTWSQREQTDITRMNTRIGARIINR